MNGFLEAISPGTRDPNFPVSWENALQVLQGYLSVAEGTSHSPFLDLLQYAQALKEFF